MSDDLLGDMLSAGSSPPPPPPPKAGSRPIDDLIASVVASARRPVAPAPAPVLDDLLRLDGPGWAVLMRYVPSDLLVPVLGGASIAVANRLVNALDHEGQAWLRSQSNDIERVTPAEHAAAAAKLLAVVRRLQDGGKLGLAATPVERVERAAAKPIVEKPVSVGVTFDAAGPIAAPAEPARRPDPVMAPTGSAAASAATAGWVEQLRHRPTDETEELMAALVAAARGKPPADLLALAEGLDHAVLAPGLRLVASGTDAHNLTAALGELQEAWLADQRRQLAVMREGLLAIRFGESADAFRAKLRRG
jgi:hypothetical protein